MNKTTAGIALVAGCLIQSHYACAGDQFGASSNRIKLSLGSYIIPRAETTFALNERDLGVGVSIDPHETLATDLEQSVFRMDAGYRFSPKHSIHLAWYKITNSGTKTVVTDFDWVDRDGNEYVIEAGSTLDSYISYNITKLSYRWTFYDSEKVELYTNAGLNYSKFAVEVEVSSTVSGAAPSTSARDISSEIPLPVVGLGVRYDITPKWTWFLTSEFFALNYGDWRGTYSEAIFGIEYTPLKHFGIAVGVGSNNLNVLEETDEYRFTYDNSITGITVQLNTMF